MKKNIFDEIFDEVYTLLNEVSTDEDKGGKVKPFQQEPMSMKERLQEYDSRGYEIFSNIAKIQGIDAATKYRDTMEREKEKYLGQLFP